MMNETLQWLTLVILFLGLVALYRQLGIYILGSRNFFEESFGPQVGQEAPARYRLLFGQRDILDRRHVVVFLSASCPICEELVSYLESMGPEAGSRMDVAIGLVAEDHEHHLSLQSRLPDFSIEPFAQIHGKDDPPRGYPFFIELDSGLHVTNKKVGANGLDLVFAAAPLAEK